MFPVYAILLDSGFLEGTSSAAALTIVAGDEIYAQRFCMRQPPPPQMDQLLQKKSVPHMGVFNAYTQTV